MVSTKLAVMATMVVLVAIIGAAHATDVSAPSHLCCRRYLYGCRCFHLGIFPQDLTL
ncbi:hypothetical protein AAHE18_18G093400 [Arachis hypogaea]